MKKEISFLKSQLSIKNENDKDRLGKIIPYPNTGYIEGSLSYPSDYIPSDMFVCAENVNSKQSYCTTKQIKDKKYTYGIGYLIEVPQGEYFVCSSVAHKGWKTCYPFHTDPIQIFLKDNRLPEKVKVISSKTTSGINL